MNIVMDWGVLNINVPRDEMLLTQTVPSEIRQLDLTEFRYAMHDKQDDEAGMPYLHMHEHNPPVTVAGVTLAQVVEIVNNYTVTFEDGLYNVNIVGGNSNVADTVIKNQVGVNTANSAGLQDSTSLQAASFQGEVVMSAFGISGTEFPIGTRRIPSNNRDDTVYIAEREGTNRILFQGNHVITKNFSNYIIIGENTILTSVHIEPEANVLNCQFEQVTISGTLDGNSFFEQCVIGELNYVNGIVARSGFNEDIIKLGGTEEAIFLNCFSMVSGTNTPTIDINGEGQSLAVREYSGGIKIINRTGSDPISIDMMSGHIIIDASCTGSPMTLRGVFKLTVHEGATYPDTIGRVMMESDIENISDVVSSDVWTNDVRTLTEGGVGGDCDNEAIAKAVWDYTLPAVLNGVSYNGELVTYNGEQVTYSGA